MLEYGSNNTQRFGKEVNENSSIQDGELLVINCHLRFCSVLTTIALIKTRLLQKPFHRQKPPPRSQTGTTMKRTPSIYNTFKEVSSVLHARSSDRY